MVCRSLACWSWAWPIQLKILLYDRLPVSIRPMACAFLLGLSHCLYDAATRYWPPSIRCRQYHGSSIVALYSKSYVVEKRESPGWLWLVPLRVTRMIQWRDNFCELRFKNSPKSRTSNVVTHQTTACIATVRLQKWRCIIHSLRASDQRPWPRRVANLKLKNYP